MTVKAAVMIHLLVGKEPLHGVNCLLTPKTDLSCRLLKLLGSGSRQIRRPRNLKTRGGLYWNLSSVVSSIDTRTPGSNMPRNTCALLVFPHGVIIRDTGVLALLPP